MSKHTRFGRSISNSSILLSITVFLSFISVITLCAFFAFGAATAESSASTPAAPAPPAAIAASAPLSISIPTVTGVVRIIRGNPETEVFFKDVKESYIIPKDSKHNELYEACEQSRKKATPVSFQVDQKSRRLLSVPATLPNVTAP